MRSILQTPEWAEFKKSLGWEILHLGDIFVHKRKTPFGQNFLYIPEVSSEEITPQQIDELKKLTKEQNSIFARLELSDRFSENAHKMIRSLGFIKAFEEVQPKWRQIVDLTPSEEEILAQMKSKGRYNIKVAERHQVEIKNQKSKIKNIDQKLENNSIIHNSSFIIQNLETFHGLCSDTVKREKIQGRPLKYFADMVDKFSETDYLEIYTANYQSEPVATALITYYQGVASYLYGGSSRRHKEVMAPYLMHWKIMQDAKERGCATYDMIGRTAPGDKKSKWAGVTRFKEQFGGEAIEVMGSYDYVNKSAAYNSFMFLEKIRRKGE